MNIEDYYDARDIGYVHAAERIANLAELHPDRDDEEGFDDRVFPEAFSEALDFLPEIEADEISDAVHEGIRIAWTELR